MSGLGELILAVVVCLKRVFETSFRVTFGKNNFWLYDSLFVVVSLDHSSPLQVLKRLLSLLVLYYFATFCQALNCDLFHGSVRINYSCPPPTSTAGLRRPQALPPPAFPGPRRPPEPAQLQSQGGRLSAAAGLENVSLHLAGLSGPFCLASPPLPPPGDVQREEKEEEEDLAAPRWWRERRRRRRNGGRVACSAGGQEMCVGLSGRVARTATWKYTNFLVKYTS